MRRVYLNRIFPGCPNCKNRLWHINKNRVLFGTLKGTVNQNFGKEAGNANINRDALPQKNMKIKKIITTGIVITAAAMLAGCGKGKEPDVGVAVDFGEELEETKETLESERDLLQTEGIKSQADSAIFNEDGSISVQLSGNARATKEEGEDETYYKVYPADYTALTPFEEEMTDEEMVNNAIDSAMNGKRVEGSIIPDGMELIDGDIVYLTLESVEGAEEFVRDGAIGGTTEYRIGSSGEGNMEMENAIIEQRQNGKIEVSDEFQGEAFKAVLKIEGIYGKRDREDLTDEWVKANYPEYANIEEFLSGIEEKTKAEFAALMEDDDYVGEKLLDRFIQESTVEGLTYDENGKTWSLAAETALAAELGIDISEEAYAAGQTGETAEDQEEARKEFVKGQLARSLVKIYREKENGEE